MIAFAIFTLFVGLVAAIASPLKVPEPMIDESGPLKLSGENVTPAGKLEFPYVVRISITRGDQSTVCGGSIISSNYVLTAARCFYPVSPPITRVRIEVGFTNLRNLTGGEYAIEIYGNPKVVIHENYNESTHINDVALLQAPFLITSSSKPIPLAPKGYDIGTGDPGWHREWPVMAGWGAQVRDGPLSSILLKKSVPTAQDSWCPHWFEFFNPLTQICIGSWTLTPVEYEDIHVGDYGNPIVLNGTQIGIASFRSRWSRPPTLYTRVSGVRDWIDKNIK